MYIMYPFKHVGTFISDLVISAPYEEQRTVERSFSRDGNTGAVYIYYGFDSRRDIELQTPQRVSCYKLFMCRHDVHTFKYVCMYAVCSMTYICMLCIFTYVCCMYVCT